MQYLTKASTLKKSHITSVRQFNRFYTRRVGALREGMVGSPYPLPEARVIYEIGHRGSASATELGRDLDLDLGYLSRLLQGLRRRGLVHAKSAAEDARRRELTLTAKGRKSYELLDGRTREEVGGVLHKLPKGSRERLVAAMQTIEGILEPRKSEVLLRAHRPGDMGWVVSRHGALYAQEHGWDASFEALVAGIAKDFLDNFDAARERCWIAEMDGGPVGSVFLVRQNTRVAKLRLLLVEPEARGRGIGRRLVEACIAFARAKGYRKLVLWTQSNLAAARAIYRAAGFRRVRTEPHSSFGARLVGEYWELAL
jgi:DNA-binding MarR family transcriptional regulator/N-acetylglutamate synthase-like GNAT family acetyltransferase